MSLLTLLALTGSALAADHIDAPTSSADPAADISDFYAWHTDDHLVVALNFAGLGMAGDPAVYDADVIYGIHIDRDADDIADANIWVRFGQDGLGNWGVQVEGMPGTGAPVEGPVEAVLLAPGGKVFTGLRDDPFFFDFDGFLDTLATSAVAFDSTRDSFAGTNVTNITIEMDRGAAANGSNNLSIWTTTARF